jgi:hypothetical protein
MGNMDGTAIEKHQDAAPHISLTMGRELLGEFFPILQKGFGVEATVPCTIKNLLCDQFGFSQQYVSERITTIFLNGKATDSIEEPIVNESSIIALSAAMPGVVGATMRRGSYYASMRSSITCTGKEKAGACMEGKIKVKLFNLLLIELGPEFLKRGVIVTSSDLLDLLVKKSDKLQQCKEVLIGGKPVAWSSLKQSDIFADSEYLKLFIALT